MRILKKVLKIFIILFIIVNFVTAVLVIEGGFEKPQSGDVLLVLGSEVEGEVPGEMLTFRLEKALELYKKGYANKIIVTGGQGPSENVPEGAAMKKYLIEKGIPPEVILIEDKSKNTYENFKFSKKIIDEQNFKNIIVVTSNFHIFRSMWTGKKLGLNVSGAPAHIGIMQAPYYLREIAAVYKYLFY